MKKVTAADIRKYYKEHKGIGIEKSKEILEQRYFNWYIEECKNLIQDFLLLVIIDNFDCYGCKYDENVNCIDECQLIVRAKELGCNKTCLQDKSNNRETWYKNY